MDVSVIVIVVPSDLVKVYVPSKLSTRFIVPLATFTSSKASWTLVADKLELALS